MGPDPACPRGPDELLDARPVVAGSGVHEEKAVHGGRGYGSTEVSNEPNGPWRCPVGVPTIGAMSERGLHRIEDDLSDTWVEDWAGAGVAEIEAYLAKHAAFLSFLESHDV